MSFAIPSLEDLIVRTRQAFATHIPGANTTAWPSNLYVSAKVIAGRVWELFHRLEYISGQSMPLTATGEYLERHAQQYGITRKLETPASGYLQVSGGTPLTEIPIGTQFNRADGTVYQSTSLSYVSSTGYAEVSVECIDNGKAGNAEAAETFSVSTPVIGLPVTAIVSPLGLGGGSDIESDDTLRERLLLRLRFPPQSGSKSDYIRWASSLSGVTRTWVQGAAFGAGTVGIWFVMDDTYEDGIPSDADVQMVQDYIDLVRPITANATVLAPTREPITIEITGLSPLTSTVVENVLKELSDMIADKAEVSTGDKPFVFRRSWVWQAVSNATGERYHTVLSPDDDITIPAGRLPVYDVKFVSVS